MTDTEPAYPPTPELDRQLEIIKSGKAEVIGDFIDWYNEQGLHLSKFEARKFEEPCPGYGLTECADGRIRDRRGNYVTCPKCGGTGEIAVEREGHWEDPRSPQTLMADFFGIDEKRIEAERREILTQFRSKNS